MRNRNLDLVGGKEPARARMRSVAEPHVVRARRDKLPARLVARLLAKLVEAVPVELVALRPKVGRVQQMHARHHKVRPFRDLGAVRERDGLLGLSAHGKRRGRRDAGALPHDAVEETELVQRRLLPAAVLADRTHHLLAERRDELRMPQNVVHDDQQRRAGRVDRGRRQAQLRAHVVVRPPVGHVLEPADGVLALVRDVSGLLRVEAGLAARHDLGHEDGLGLAALLLQETGLGEEAEDQRAQQRVDATGAADRADAVLGVADGDVEPVLVAALRSPQEDERRQAGSHGLGDLVEADILPVWCTRGALC